MLVLGRDSVHMTWLVGFERLRTEEALQVGAYPCLHARVAVVLNPRP